MSVPPAGPGRAGLSSLPDQLATRLAAEIATGERAGGERLHEQDLADRFRVSRSTVREAIWILERDGLALVTPRRGAAVVQLTDRDRAELREVCAVLVARMGELAARRRTIDAVRDIRAALAALGADARASSPGAFALAHHDFVWRLSALAENLALSSQIRNCLMQLGPAICARFADPMARERVCNEWGRFLDAVEGGAPNAAGEAVPGLIAGPDGAAGAARP